MQQKGVTVMLAYKLPEHADGICEKYGIEVHLGYNGNVHEVVEKYLITKNNKH